MTIRCEVTEGRLINLIRATVQVFEERLEGEQMVFDVSVDPWTQSRLTREPALHIDDAKKPSKQSVSDQTVGRISVLIRK